MLYTFVYVFLEYLNQLKSTGIPNHIDTHSAFDSPILSLSLGSDVVMEFKRESQHLSVLLPQRSLLIMDGEARYVHFKSTIMNVINVFILLTFTYI